MRGITIGLLMGVALFGQSTAPPQRPGISGRVLRQNGDAAPRVIVTLLGPERYEVTTDARGAFTFGDVAPGPYSLVAHRPGYSAVKYGGSTPLAVYCSGIDESSWAHAVGADDAFAVLQGCIGNAPGITLRVRPNVEIKDVTLRIAQVGVIRGKVTNQDLEGVPSQVMAMVREPGSRTLRTVESSSSMDQDGNYTVDDLPPGHYYLLARSRPALPMVGLAQGQVQSSKAPAESDTFAYYPSAPDEAKASLVEVKAGEELRGIDIVMRRGMVFTVRGAVVMPPGTPASVGASVIIVPKGGGNGVIIGARSGGSFEFRGVEPGTYIITVRAQNLFGTREVTVTSGDMEGVNLTVSPAVALSGAVKMEGGTPAVWPSVTLKTDDGTIGGLVKPGADGKFTVTPALAPMEYAVRMAGMPSGTYVKSMSFGKQDALHSKLDLSAGGSDSNLDIVISGNAASLSGKVTDAGGAGAKGFQITVWSRTEPGGEVHFANTDQDGNFSITDLGPGEYLAAAWESLPAALSDDTGFLGRFQTMAASVRLEEGSQAKMDLKLIPREKSDAEAEKLP